LWLRRLLAQEKKTVRNRAICANASALHGYAVHEAVAVRQGLQERPAVALGQHARVEQNDHAGVAAGANEPAETLLQLDDRLRHLVVEKGHTACRLDGLTAGLDDRPVRDGERQPRDQDVRQRLALHVNPLPEAIDAEQHRVTSSPEAL